MSCALTTLCPRAILLVMDCRFMTQLHVHGVYLHHYFMFYCITVSPLGGEFHTEQLYEQLQ